MPLQEPAGHPESALNYCRESGPVADAGRSGLFGAVGAAIDHVILLDAVPDDAAPAIRTCGRQLLDGTFEAVEV
jgi:hypothetical protein